MWVTAFAVLHYIKGVQIFQLHCIAYKNTTVFKNRLCSTYGNFSNYDCTLHMVLTHSISDVSCSQSKQSMFVQYWTQ